MNRILYVVGQLGLGGCERQLYYLLQAMNRETYYPAVVVWSSTGKMPNGSNIQALGIPVYYFSSKLSRISKLRALRSLVRELSPEVVHSYSFYTNFAAWWCTRGTKTISVGSIRNNFVSERREAGNFLGQLSARWPPVQICNSHAGKREVARAPWPFKPAQVLTVRNRLDLRAFVPHPTLPKEPTVLALGRLYPEKRWDRLIKVMALAKATGVRCLIRQAGEGPLLHNLKRETRLLGVEQFIEFLGPRHDIEELMADSMFLVHTADEEGCPNVVMEAMACARAVVATDAGDVPYLVEEGKTGFIVPRGDDMTLVERMATLINNRELCFSMGQAGRAKAEQEFGLDRLVSETMAAYRVAGWREA